LTDSLATWLEVRERVEWTRTRPHPQRDASATRDGIAEYIDTEQRARGDARAEGLLAAVGAARSAAARGDRLDTALLSDWQRLILGAEERIAFRGTTAFAKGGRERYGLNEDTSAEFDRCLSQSQSGGQDALPLAARAARVYLDVCFFHPFPDGNSRAALVVLDFVLARAQVRLDQAAPLALPRRADDADGALALADLVAILITRASR
jgi:Fic/DOC family protein